MCNLYTAQPFHEVLRLPLLHMNPVYFFHIICFLCAHQCPLFFKLFSLSSFKTSSHNAYDKSINVIVVIDNDSNNFGEKEYFYRISPFNDRFIMSFLHICKLKLDSSLLLVYYQLIQRIKLTIDYL